MANVLVVRSLTGTALHEVRAIGDGGSGETRCGMRGRSWAIVADGVLTCRRCIAAIEKRRIQGDSP